MKDGIIGFAGLVFASITPTDVNMWLDIVCKVAIAVTTCGIQVYRLIRDRNKDKEKQEETKNDSTVH